MLLNFTETYCRRGLPPPLWRETGSLSFVCVRRTVTKDMCGRLLTPSTEQELLVALRSLAKGSCPGVDGLAPPFFLRHWEVLALGLCCAFQEVMRTREIPMAFVGGLFPIPKEKGNVEEI